MKKWIALTLLFLLLAGCTPSKADIPENVVAEYRGHQVTVEVIAQNVEIVRFLSGGQQQPTEAEMLEEVLENMILFHEAEQQGLTVTEEELQAALDNIAAAYAIPEGQAMMDSYFEEYGLTYDMYMEMLQETLPRTIARQKLRDAMGREYCEKHGLEFTKVNPPKEMTETVEKAIEKLVRSEQKYVTYYR